MKDEVTRILENHFLYKRGGYPKAAQICLEAAQSRCKDNFQKRYEEVKERMEGGKEHERNQREVASAVSGE